MAQNQHLQFDFQHSKRLLRVTEWKWVPVHLPAGKPSHFSSAAQEISHLPQPLRLLSRSIPKEEGDQM